MWQDIIIFSYGRADTLRVYTVNHFSACIEIDSTKPFVMNLITASIAVAALAACTTAQDLDFQDYYSDQSTCTVMGGLMEIKRAYLPTLKCT